MPFHDIRVHGITILNGGVTTLAGATFLDFEGDVTGTVVGDVVTETIGGGGGSLLTIETPSGTIDGTNTVFTTVHQPSLLTLNGQILTPGGVDYTLSGSYTETLVNAPEPGDILRSYY